MTWFKSKDNITAFVATLIAVIALATSFYKTDPDVYLFPRISAVIIALLAVVLLLKTFMGSSIKTLSEAKLINWKTLLPGLIIGLVYLLSLEIIGFYVSSFVAYFAICVVYGKCDMLNVKRGLFKIGVSTVFMVILFLLFWNLLHVRTPTGFLI
jgi:hypothetical protein